MGQEDGERAAAAADLQPATPKSDSLLAANVRPAVGTPLAPVSANDYIRPYVIRAFDGVKVALIGIDVAGKTCNSSPRRWA